MVNDITWNSMRRQSHGHGAQQETRNTCGSMTRIRRKETFKKTACEQSRFLKAGIIDARSFSKISARFHCHLRMAIFVRAVRMNELAAEQVVNGSTSCGSVLSHEKKRFRKI